MRPASSDSRRGGWRLAGVICPPPGGRWRRRRVLDRWRAALQGWGIGRNWVRSVNPLLGAWGDEGRELNRQRVPVGGGWRLGVEALDGLFVTNAEAGFVAGHAVDFGSGVAPCDPEEHVGYVTLVAGAVVGGVEFMKEIAGRVREGVLLEGQLAVEVDESGFGANEVLEADFAEGDFRDCCFFERGLGEKVVVVASGAFGDLLRGFRVIVKGGVVGAEAVF